MCGQVSVSESQILSAVMLAEIGKVWDSNANLSKVRSSYQESQHKSVHAKGAHVGNSTFACNL